MLPLISALVPVLGTVLDRLLPDPAARAAAELELVKMHMAGDLAQLDVNKAEAASTNWFVAGGRPAVIWICAAGLGYASLIEPLARFVAKVWFHYDGEFPIIDTTVTMQMLAGLLGLSGMRSFDKVKGVAR